MRVFVALFLMTSCIGVKASEQTSHVICSVSSYVDMGLEFDACQATALRQVAKHPEGDPCPMIRKVVEVCGANIRSCFTDLGWRRSQRLLFATLSLHYPETNNCGLTNSSAGVEELERVHGDEMCSVAMELNAAQKMAVCSNELQNELVHDLRLLDRNETMDKVCEAFAEIKEKCVDNFLAECHVGYDLKAQVAFAMERMLIAADMLVMHFANLSDVAACPVFQHRHDAHHDQVVLVVVLIVLVVVLVVATTALLLWLALKLRLASRLKAWRNNAPYADMVDNGASHHEMSNNIQDSHRHNG